MNKADRDYIKQGVKDVPTQDLTEYILAGIATFTLAKMKGDKDRISRYGKELFLLEQELKSRGLRLKREQTELGRVLSFVPYTKPDPLRNSPIKLVIPSVDQLINGPIAHDLPKHGYLSSSSVIHLPEKM
jgi:hypothetical protein